jgi:hypothetical protein
MTGTQGMGFVTTLTDLLTVGSHSPARHIHMVSLLDDRLISKTRRIL